MRLKDVLVPVKSKNAKKRWQGLQLLLGIDLRFGMDLAHLNAGRKAIGS